MALPSFGGAGGGKVRMASLDDGGLATPLSLTGDFDVKQFADVRLHTDVDTVLGDEALAFGECLGREVLQHLQLVFRLADEGSQRNGDGQTYHAGAGNADTHRVFQDVARQLGSDFFWSAAQQLGGTSRAEGHCHRFRTADGRHHFLLDEADERLSLLFCYHGFFGVSLAP